MAFLDNKKLNISIGYNPKKQECIITKKEGLLTFYQEMYSKELLKSAVLSTRASALNSIYKLQKDIADADREPKSRQIVMSVDPDGTVHTEGR